MIMYDNDDGNDDDHIRTSFFWGSGFCHHLPALCEKIISLDGDINLFLTPRKNISRGQDDR